MKDRFYNRKIILGLYPKTVLFFFFAAFFIGLAGTWLPAFGYLPVIGKETFSLAPWRDLFHHYSFQNSLITTLISGWGAAIFSLLLSFLITALSYKNRYWNAFQKALPPILSIPHAAFTVGVIFLIAPSGWIMRVFSPTISGLTSPPDWLIVKDVWGLSLMVVLILKETPFLLFIIISSLSSLKVNQTLVIGKSLGYSEPQIWIKLIFPRLYSHIRLPFFAVIAYSLSVVDIALIIGPTAPPTLAVLILQWFNEPDLNLRLIGSAGSCGLLILVLVSIGIVSLCEKIAQPLSSIWYTNGKRHSKLKYFKPLSNGILTLFSMTCLLGSFILIVWSFAQRWRFPDIFPTDWRLRFWEKALTRASDPIWNTLSIGMVAAISGMILVIGCLEYELILKKEGKQINYSKILWLIYIPLLMPQIAFMFGIQIFLSRFYLDRRWGSLVWSHLLFVLPYCFLTLSTTYRKFDHRYMEAAQALCGSYFKSLIRVKLPLLLKPILFTFAIGFSVSVAQYLPTLFIGGGRYQTLTIETVNLASGSDRRILSVFALLQLFLPLLVFFVAMLLPKILFWNRKGV